MHDPLLVDEPLHVFGQNPRLSRLYTQLCFCFRLPDGQSQSSVLELLSHGLERLSASFPWVAGQVVNEAGLFKIKPLEKTPRIVVRDLRHELPSMDEIRDAGYPFSMLDENVIALRKTLPEHFDEPALAFLIQANFIRGGLLLVFIGQHNCMDMRGQCQIIYLLSKACRRVPFTSEELLSGNLSHSTIIPLLDKEELQSISSRQQRSSAPSKADTAPLTSPKSIWAYFIFSPIALSSLKTAATQTVISGYVSTDDVLSAFIWQAVTRARLPHLDSRTTESTFERQVDVRKHLNIPITYIGNMVYKTSNTCLIQDLIQEPLGVTASRLRSSLTPISDIAYQIRVEATNLSDQVSKPTANVAVTPRTKLPEMNIRMSSWAKEECYGFDFGGLLAKAVAVRRPNFEAWEGLAYLLPKRLDGEIAAAVCLREDDMERLRIDAEFVRFGRYIG